jgi:hypothetical protein
VSSDDRKRGLIGQMSTKEPCSSLHRWGEIRWQEEWLLRGVKVKPLYEEVVQLDFALDATSFKKGDLVLDQRVLLQDPETEENLLFVASLLALDALPCNIRGRMQNEHQTQPLVRLFQDMPIHQELLACEIQSADQLLAEYIAIDSGVLCLARTRLYSLHIPVLLVHEVIASSRPCPTCEEASMDKWLG